MSIGMMRSNLLSCDGNMAIKDQDALLVEAHSQIDSLSGFRSGPLYRVHKQQ